MAGRKARRLEGCKDRRLGGGGLGGRQGRHDGYFWRIL